MPPVPRYIPPPAQDSGVVYHGENKAHGGYLATNIARQNLLPG